METKASANFKKNAVKAVWAIVFFEVVYMFLFVLALLLVALCVGGGIFIIMYRPTFSVLLFGSGIAMAGIFIFIFLVKYFFKKNEPDTSLYVEVTREQEPRLFEIISDVVNEVKAESPKKVYLSDDVNAGVFFDSSFWSMFVPVSKNLIIGLGLVNSVTIQEFKGILAHEFGHFSQKSMKIGSYVYNVHKIIYDMLYDNGAFENMIQRWARINAFFLVFVKGAAIVIRGIQWVLTKTYSYLNREYMALSREMEFDADRIAAEVVGDMPVSEALLRTDLSKYAYDIVLNFYEGKIADNVKSENIYREHRYVLNFLANDIGLPLQNGFPLITGFDLKTYNKSKLNVKDQWASHPNLEERTAELKKQNATKKYDARLNSPAVTLLSNSEDIEREITVKLFETAVYKSEPSILFYEDFVAELADNNIKEFPKIYNGYYNNRVPATFDLENLPGGGDNVKTLDELYGKTVMELVYNSFAIENDGEILNQIVTKQLQVKSFDYDGRKYKSKEAGRLIVELREKFEEINSKLAENDKDIYCFFYSLAQKTGEEKQITSKYLKLFEKIEAQDAGINLFNKITEKTDFLGVSLPFDDIRRNFNEMLDMEKDLKAGLKKLLEDENLTKEMSLSTKEIIQKYMNEDLEYFHGISYDDENLETFFTALRTYQYLIIRDLYQAKSGLLVFQSELLK